jgi:HK97 gp10 family phage protein
VKNARLGTDGTGWRFGRGLKPRSELSIRSELFFVRNAGPPLQKLITYALTKEIGFYFVAELTLRIFPVYATHATLEKLQGKIAVLQTPTRHNSEDHMSNPVTVQVKGLKELQHALEQETPKRVRAILRSALNAGAKIIQAAVKREAPRDTGQLEGSIDIKISIKTLDVRGSAFIGPSKSKTKKNIKRKGFLTRLGIGPKGIAKGIDDVTLTRFFEGGTSKMAADPFMTRGFEMSKMKAMETVIAKIREALKL